MQPQLVPVALERLRRQALNQFGMDGPIEHLEREILDARPANFLSFHTRDSARDFINQLVIVTEFPERDNRRSTALRGRSSLTLASQPCFQTLQTLLQANGWAVS